MITLRQKLEKARHRTGLPWETLERDYLLSWILAAIGRSATLREALVFKGGTALKKCYFGDYRFSEDLDFSALPSAPRASALHRAVETVCRDTMDLLDEYAPVDLACARYRERAPHPTGQEAFVVRARLPWHRDFRTRILIEITIDEEILWPIRRRQILHEYGEPLDAEILVYALEEIVAEKLRALLQYAERLQQRGWSRSRARDYYDLWRILTRYRDELALENLASLLLEKAERRGVTFSSLEDFFAPTILSQVRDTWSQWLGPLVPELPSVDRVINDLRDDLGDCLPKP